MNGTEAIQVVKQARNFSNKIINVPHNEGLHSVANSIQNKKKSF